MKARYYFLFILLMIAGYFLVAFIKCEFDFKLWQEYERAIYATLWTMISVVITGALYWNDKINNR